MKIACISDIHGNAHALEKVLIDINKKNVDKIYVMGDLCYRGPEPKRSMDLIRSLNAEVIKGNADEWVVRGVRKGEVADTALEMMNRERDWVVSKLDQTDIDYLAQLPTEINVRVEGVALHLFHATPDSLFEIVPPGADDEIIKSKLMSSKDAQIYIYAHVHKPYTRYLNGKVIMNTGSVGLPFDSLAMASYATIEITEGAIRTSIERVSFDIEEVVMQYQASDYPNAEMMAKVLRNARVNI
ncbi:YfcE family phosphodiesterase [Paenibacillus sp. LMG 31456]|uniref:YfcE family phosphodiesterase n=1 Tax=Paenibacillus foliorum TaxID=2654974 RepID=A0A972H0N9_9BACL|nr:metallophosphoesterase family protein [Paenibacillus foliorum]NOU98069.1 YfcE family phosphodiesterase [Paenibacillus foliorum]